jgi:hypothetical protein
MAADDYGGRKRNRGISSGGGDGMGGSMPGTSRRRRCWRDIGTHLAVSSATPLCWPLRQSLSCSRTRGPSTHHVPWKTIASGFFAAVSADCDTEEPHFQI